MINPDPIAALRAEAKAKLARCIRRAADRVLMGLEPEREYVQEIRRCQNELGALDAIAREVRLRGGNA